MFGIDSKYYLGGYVVGGDENTYATETWDWMIDNDIKSIIDIGCGEGHSTKYFFDKGCEVLGIEGSIKAINNSPIKNKLILHDYTQKEYIPNKRYDAAWCCEFVEHVEEKYIDNFLATMKYVDKIFLTHALPGQGGYHHVNEQNAEYWIDKIESLNFRFNSLLSEYLRAITMAKWTKTLLVFEKI
jgi:cyclopropane fatty-acyl-phospholipid synthase-like methyltransferase